jgi:MFS family permease
MAEPQRRPLGLLRAVWPSWTVTQPVRGHRALDWFTFFCANLQTGFGPFLSVYLTAAKWTQTDIGLILMIGGLGGLFFQIPGGALVDKAQSKVAIASLAVAVIGVSALCAALSTLFPIILLAWILHAVASCVLSPAITTISLGLSGYDGIGRRLGRNATFASIGSALAAIGMGACGYYLSNQAVFFITAALALPALGALWAIGRSSAPAPAVAPAKAPIARSDPASWRLVLTNRPLMILAIATSLFYLGNAAMLPLIGSVLTMRSEKSPALLIAACIVVPQILVALLSPFAGSKAQSWGRRPLLLIGFCALPLRGLCLGLVRDPNMFVLVQILDGVSASILGVVIPLVAADATRGLGRFALAQGVIGTAMGLGAAFSSTYAGYLTDHYGSATAFYGLTFVAMVGLLITTTFMPETRGLTVDTEAPSRSMRHASRGPAAKSPRPKPN